MRAMLRKMFWHYLARWRWRVIAKLLEGDVLDVGCGSGGLYQYAKEKGVRNYLGIDVSDRRKIKEFEFCELDIESRARELIHGSFDRVVLAACVEHLDKPAEVLKWCRTVLRPSGLLIITTPTPRGQKLLRLIFAGGSEHTKIYNKPELFQQLQSAGFKVTQYRTFEMGANQLVVAALR
ncbi:class I SAM-dependent methyltransferase [Dehalococcoidia bacterium]|nr:class I SAM-dependent methyltransferase [Dehalococcoidia bacterium]